MNDDSITYRQGCHEIEHDDAKLFEQVSIFRI